MDGVEDLGVDVSGDEEGVSLLHRFFYGDIAWHGVVVSSKGSNFCFIFGSCWDGPEIPPLDLARKYSARFFFSLSHQQFHLLLDIGPLKSGHRSFYHS